MDNQDLSLGSALERTGLISTSLSFFFLTITGVAVGLDVGFWGSYSCKNFNRNNPLIWASDEDASITAPSFSRCLFAAPLGDVTVCVIPPFFVT